MLSASKALFTTLKEALNTTPVLLLLKEASSLHHYTGYLSAWRYPQGSCAYIHILALPASRSPQLPLLLLDPAITNLKLGQLGRQ
jgi:hypothetical protein